MTEIEVDRIINLINEHNRNELGTLAASALYEELPNLEFEEVVTRMTEIAKVERWITPADVLGLKSAKEVGKYDDADAAWKHINELAKEGDGLLALIANIDSVKWSDPNARQALLDARQTLRTTKADNALWEFRKAYNRLNDEGESEAHTVGQLAEPKARAVLRDPTAGTVTAGSEAKRMLAEMRKNLAKTETPEGETG